MSLLFRRPTVQMCIAAALLGSFVAFSACDRQADDADVDAPLPVVTLEPAANSSTQTAEPATPGPADAARAEAIRIDEALETIPWQSAASFLDQEVFVVGRVARAGRSTGHIFLNFDKADRDSLTLFIHRSSVDNFAQPPDKLFQGKVVRARGFVYEYNGKPNLAIKVPADIEILPDATPLPPVREPVAPTPVAAPADGAITIASYNVLNLFDAHDDPYSADSASDVKPRAELEALARSIRKLNADVIGLQEVENRGILQRFVRVFLRDMNYEVVAFEGNDNRGIDVALLSRLPVGPVTSHRHVDFEDAQGKPMRFRRDLLQARIEPPGAPAFDVYVVHLKSKGGVPEGGADTRMGEARAIAAVLHQRLAADPQARFVICGDFNDTIDSEPVTAIMGTNGRALRTFIDDLPEDGRVSYNQPPFLSMIDFILASPAMADTYVAGSYQIITGGSPETTGSDHNPVVARFKLK